MTDTSVPPQDFLAQLVSNSLDGILAFDRDCCYTVWNPAMEQMTGLSSEQVLGRSAFEVHPCLREIGEDHYFYEALAGRRAISSNRPFANEKGAKQGLLEGAYAPVYDKSGNIIGGLAIIRDVTERIRELEQLKKSEQRLEEAQALAHFGSWEWDVSSDRVVWSDELYRIFGVSADDGDMSLQRYRELIHPDDRHMMMKTIDHSLVSGLPFEVEHRVQWPDGTVRWILGKGHVVNDDAGRPVRMFGASLDITEHRELQRRIEIEAELRDQHEVVATINRIGTTLSAELDLQRLVQAVTDAATEVSGAQFGAFFFNQVGEGGERYTLYTLSGAPREAFANYPLPRMTGLFGPTFRGEGAIRIGDVAEDARYAQNPPYNGMPKGHLPVRSYLAVPVLSRTGDVMGGLFFGHAEPNIFTEQAEHIVVGLAAQTAIAMDNARLFLEAQQAIQARDTFLSMASHELKTPTASIVGYAQLLEKRSKLEGTSETRQGRSIQVLRGQAERLERLVRTLFDLAHLNLGVFELHRVPLDMTLLVKRIVDGLQVSLHNHHVTVQVEGEPHIVDGDEVRMEQVIQNVLQNAIKYSPDGGAIEIALAPQDDSIVLTVRDHGIGIPETALSQIFNRFYRASNVIDRHVAGLGVGLNIVREIVTLHGGRIEVDSVLDQGTTFRMFFPRAKPAYLLDDLYGAMTSTGAHTAHD